MSAMKNMREMEFRYASLKRARDNGSITAEQFQNDVAQLRLQGPGGDWYQIDPDGGYWLRWNGQLWQRAQPPGVQQQVPRKFLPLLGYIFKSTFRAFRQQLPKMIFFGILGWLLHTFLLVFINEGFGASTFVGKFLATQRNTLSGTIIWMVVSGFLFGWLGRKIIAKKAGKAPKQASLWVYFQKAGGLALASILAAAGLSLIVGLAVNMYANLVLAAGFIGLMLSRGGSVVGLLLNSAWSSIYGLAQRRQTVGFNMAAGHVAMVGGVLGFLLSSFMPPVAKVIFGIAMLVGAFSLTHRHGQGQPAATALSSILPPLILGGVFLYLSKANPVFADDGGWAEAGGTFAGWIGSEGAAQAMVMGVGPAVATMIGPALGQTLIDASGNLPLDEDVSEEMEQLSPEDRPSLVDEHGDPLVQWYPEANYPDIDGNTGQPGDVLLWDKWVKPEVARREVSEKLAARQRENEDWAKGTEENKEMMVQKRAVEKAEAEVRMKASARQQAEDAGRAEAEQRLRDRMINRLGEDKDLQGPVDQLIAANDIDGLKEIYREKLREQITEGERDVGYYNREATAWGAAESGARMVVAGSKAALMTIGGPAGAAATVGLVATVSAAEEGAESYQRGDPIGEVAARTAMGFLSGAKDAAIGRYTNMPGVGRVAKTLLPAGADAAEAYARARIDNPKNESHSESLRKALGAGGLSVASDLIGGKVDDIQPGAFREATRTLAGGVSGGVSNLVQGGDFGEGFQQGVEGSIGGRVGSKMGGKAADYARTKIEQTVQQAIKDVKDQRDQEIPIERQSEKVQALDKTRYEQNGKEYVNERGALEQIKDTQSSRTAKQAPDDIQKAIINTRQEKIYGPADAATISKAESRLADKGILQPGDKLKMDPFSTPGKPPSLGADRDARLVIERTDPVTGKVQQIEVPRKYWEDDAYKDFYEHTTKIAGGEQAITPESQPEYFRRLDELESSRKVEQVAYQERMEQWNKQRQEDPDFNRPPPKPPMTEEQVRHRAWAEAHNQLFTDKTHVEASADNSDQLTKFVEGGAVPAQRISLIDGKSTSPVEQAQKGNQRLLDPEGYARMWEEKSQVYVRMGNQPEAIAQSQKGIAQYSELRDGYHAQGFEVPPLDTRTAKAMEIITTAPVGIDATPEALARVESQLQDLGYRDTNDALGKISTQHEVLKFARPRTELGTGMLSRLGRDNIPPETQQPNVDQ